MARLHPSPNWTLAYENGHLLVTAGADAVFTVEDLDPDAATWIASAWNRGTVDTEAALGDASRAVQELMGAGILRPHLALSTTSVTGVRVVWVGDRCAPLAARLAADAPTVGLELTDDAPDLDLVIRTNAPLAALRGAQSPKVAALLVDCAYEHTVSLGPLAVPGATACLHCYAERLTARWGDPTPPVQPRVLDEAPFIAALALAELRSAAANSSVLVNRSVAYDRQTHTVLRETLHRTPGCVLCDPRAARAATTLQSARA